MSRQFGKFSVVLSPLTDDWQSLVPVFEGLVVVRAEANFEAGKINYVALGPEFDPVAMGSPVPEYEAICHTLPDGTISVEWRKLS